MRRLLTILLCLPLLAQACVPERDDYGRIKRSRKVVAIFRATVPCPATGEVGKRCKGFVVDHRQALCVCGPDTVQNLQWMTVAAAKIKDRFECRPDWEKRLMEFERGGLSRQSSVLPHENLSNITSKSSILRG